MARFRFNPHPTFLPGDAEALLQQGMRSPVSIRTRHFCRVMLDGLLKYAMCAPLVSIRTRHFCRVMRAAARYSGCRGDVSIRTRHFCRVMRAPAHGVHGSRGVSIRTRHFCRVMRGECGGGDIPRQVSIRTRHFCRVMRSGPPWRSRRSSCFNPHPTFLPGDAPSAARRSGKTPKFQSAPDISAG